MRGKDVEPKRTDQKFRITPAYAGKREHWGYLSQAIWDHPRLCGEKGIKSLTGVRNSGSPPPMRGKVLNDDLTVQLYRGSPPPMRGKD